MLKTNLYQLKLSFEANKGKEKNFFSDIVLALIYKSGSTRVSLFIYIISLLLDISLYFSTWKT